MPNVFRALEDDDGKAQDEATVSDDSDKPETERRVEDVATAVGCLLAPAGIFIVGLSAIYIFIRKALIGTEIGERFCKEELPEAEQLLEEADGIIRSGGDATDQLARAAQLLQEKYLLFEIGLLFKDRYASACQKLDTLRLFPVK